MGGVSPPISQGARCRARCLGAHPRRRETRQCHSPLQREGCRSQRSPRFTRLLIGSAGGTFTPCAGTPPPREHGMIRDAAITLKGLSKNQGTVLTSEHIAVYRDGDGQLHALTSV